MHPAKPMLELMDQCLRDAHCRKTTSCSLARLLHNI